MSEEGEPKKMLKAEVLFCIENEMTCTPTDFFIRRTGRLFFDPKSVILYKEFVISLFKNCFSWDEETAKFHQQELKQHLETATNFN